MSASASAGDSIDDNASQSSTSSLSSSSAARWRLKRKAASSAVSASPPVPSSLPAEVREQWAGVGDESLLFDEVLTSHAFLLTATQHYQYLPVPWLPPSAAPLPPQAVMAAVRDRAASGSSEEEDEKDEADSSSAGKAKADAQDAAAPAPSSSASLSPSPPPASSAALTAPPAASSGSAATAKPAPPPVSALTEAQQLLVESCPPPPVLPDSLALNSRLSSGSSSSSELPSVPSAAPASSFSSSSQSHLASIAAALSSGPLLELPRSLPSLAYVDLHARREHVLRHLLLLTAAAQRRSIEHSSRDRKDDSKRKKAAARHTTASSSSTTPSSSTASPSASSSSSASPLLRMTILSLFPIIQSLSKQDPELLSHILSTLLSLLHSLPLLSLRHEAEDCIASFRSLLQQMTAGPQQQRLHVDAGEALSALTGLALAEGKVRHVLAAIALMLRLSPITGRQDVSRNGGSASIAMTSEPRLSVSPFVSQLADYRADRHLPTLEPASFLFSFQHYSPSLSFNRFVLEYSTPSSPPPPAPPSSSASALGVDVPFLGSIACDGVFLYVLNEYGLFTVGSGHGGSLQRHVYSENRNFHNVIAERAKATCRAVEEEEQAKAREAGGAAAPPRSPAQSTAADAAAAKAKPADGKAAEKEKSDAEPEQLRSGTLLFVNKRLFFASPNYELMMRTMALAAAASSSSSSASSSALSSLLTLPTSSALIVEIDAATLEVKSGSLAISHSRSSLPLYMSITTDGQHIYAMHREQKQRQRGAALASASPSSSSPLSSSSSSSSSSPLSSSLFAVPNCVDVYSLEAEPAHFSFVRSFSLDDSASAPAASASAASSSLAYERNVYAASSLSSSSLPSTPFTCYCFLESDTRILTNWGLLFLDEIEALQRAGEEVLFGCYAERSTALLYSKGRLVFPKRPPPYLVDLTSAGEAARWADGSGDYGTEGVPDDNPSSRHVSLRVTPEHDMYVQLGSCDRSGTVHWSSKGRPPGSTAKTPKPHSKVQAQDLLSTDARACVRMLACAQAGYAPQATSQRREVQSQLHLDDTQFTAFIALLAFWLADGTLDCIPAVNGSAAGYVRFSQVKQTDLRWLRSTVRKAGLKEGEHWLSGSNGRQQTTLFIREPAWFAFFDREFGGKSVQHLPDWTLQELSAAEMRLLISGLHRADGSFAAGENVIYTSSARFRDQLMQALLHCGYSACAGLMYRKAAIRGYNFHDQSNDTKMYSVSFFARLDSKEQLKYRPIKATADSWKVSWAELGHDRNTAAAGSCWPSMSRQQCVTRVPYDAERDGRTWCVEVEHADHLIFAQRAQRLPDGTVTKQSRPIVVGNCTGEMGGYLVRMTVPNRMGGAYASISRQDVFSCDSGRLVSRISVGVAAEGEAKGSAVCYDAVNDCIWQYQHSQLVVQAWKNMQTVNMPPPQLPQPFVLTDEEAEADSAAKKEDATASVSHLLPACAALAHHIARQCVLVPPASGLVSSAEVLSYATYGETTGRAAAAGATRGETYLTAQALPLSIDLHNDTFRHLTAVLSITSAALTSSNAASALSAAASSSLFHLLSCCLDVLKTNLTHLPSPFDDDAVSPAASHLPSSSSALAVSAAVTKPSKHRISSLSLYGIEPDVMEQLCSLLLSFLTVSLPSLPPAQSQQLVQQSMAALMSGLPHFFPTAAQLLSLLREPYLAFPRILEDLVAYPGLCIIVSSPAAVEEQLAEPAGLLHVLTARVQAESVGKLERGEETRSPLLSPSLRLLAALQRSLLSRVDDSSIRPLVLQYATSVLRVSVELLHRARELLPAVPRSTQRIDHILRSSVVGVLLPPLLSTLSRRDLLCRLETSTCTSLVQPAAPFSLSKLLQALDSYLQLSDGSSALDAGFLNQPIAPSKRLMHTVETLHPYDGRRLHSSLAFSQCQYLVLYFDPRSVLHKTDSLTLTAITGEMKAAAITGSAFPRLPLVIAGDSLTVSFTPESQAGGGAGGAKGKAGDKLYGFKLVIHGVRLSPLLSLSWTADLLNSLALLSARVVHSLAFTAAVQAAPQPELLQLINQELFTGGLVRTAAAAAAGGGDHLSHCDAFLQRLISNESPAREWMDLMLKKFTGRPPLSGTARKAISSVERVMAAVLLHHTDLVSAAASIAHELLPNAGAGSSSSSSAAGSVSYPDLATAHPDFALLQPLFRQLYALDAVFLTAARVEKRWQDLLAAGVSEAARELKGMHSSELAQLCAVKGVAHDRADNSVSAQRLSKKLALELSRQSASAATAGGDLWMQAYSIVSQRFVDRCLFLLSLRSPAASYPPLLKQPTVPALAPLSASERLPAEDEALSSASSQATSPSLSPRSSMSRSYTDQLRRGRSISAQAESASLPLSRVNSSSSKQQQLARSVLGRPTLSESPNRLQKAGVDHQSSFAVWKQRERQAHSASSQSLAAMEQQSRLTPQDRRVRSIISFLSSPSALLDAPALSRALDDRQRASCSRVDGLLAFHELLLCCHFDSARNSLLLGFGEGMRRYWTAADAEPAEGDAGRHVHYLNGLNGVGPEVAARVRSAWFQLLSGFVSLLQSGCHPSTKLLTLDCVALFYRPEDVCWLSESQLFPALRSLMSQSASAAIAAASRSLFSHLASICLWWSPQQLQLMMLPRPGAASALSSPRASLSGRVQASSQALLSLQHELFTAIFQELKKEMQTLARLQQPTVASSRKDEEQTADSKEKEQKDQSSSSKQEDKNGVADGQSSSGTAAEEADLTLDADSSSSSSSSSVDSACYELLCLIFQLRHSAAAHHHLSKSLEALTTLLSVLSQPSTLRVQRLSIRLLRFMLTDADIGTKLMVTLGSAGQALLSLTSSTTDGGDGAADKESSFVSVLFDRIGELLVTGGSTAAVAASASASSSSAASDSAVSVLPRRLSDPHHHHHADGSGSGSGGSGGSELFNLSILNTDVENVSAASFANSVLGGLKDVLKASVKSFKSDLRSALSSSAASSASSASSVVIMNGSREEMNRVARIVAKRGFCCQIAPAPVQDGFIRNQMLAQYNPSALQSGQSLLELTAEIVAMLRVLSQSALWSQAVDRELTARLQRLQGCAKKLLSSPPNAAAAARAASAPLSALAVLGGYAEVLRLGGRVRLSSADSEDSEWEYGVLVDYQRGETHAQVVMEGEDQPVTVDVDRLTAVPPPYSASDALSRKPAVDAILAFLQDSSDRSGAQQQDDRADSVSSAEAEQQRLTAELSLYCLRALCSALRDQPELASSLSSHSGLMSFLISTAKQSEPSASLSELEQQVLQSLERFLSLQHPPLYPAAQHAQQPSDQELSALLPHFPYAAQAKRLATGFSVDHARFVIFEDAARRTLQYTKDPHGGGSEFSLSRSSGSSGSGSSSAIRRIEEQLRADTSDEYLLLGNAGVPVSLPHFYFEVELLTSNHISIGFCPQPRSVFGSMSELGIEQLEQMSAGHPSYARLHSLIKQRLNNAWCDHSVRYSSRDGHCLRRQHGKEQSSAYAEAAGLKGDVLGVGWSLRDGSVFFTKNGRHLGTAATIQPSASAGLALKLFPAVGFVSAGSRVRINFGQEQFAFKLEAEAAGDESDAEKKERLQRAAAAEAAQKEAEEQARVRAEVEKVARQAAREDAAQSLLDMCFGLLPSQRHALKALELHRDNAQAAANFIFENEVAAIQEINRLIREEDEARQREQKREDDKHRAERKEEKDAEHKQDSSSKAKQPTPATAGNSASSTSKPADSSKPSSASSSADSAPPTYDRSHSSSLLLGTAYSRPVVDDGSDVDPVEEQWLQETEALLRAARLFPSDSMLSGIMGQLRQGGDARANAILSLPISLPMPAQQRRDGVEEQKPALRLLKAEEARPGIRVKIASPPHTARLSAASLSTSSAAAAASTSAYASGSQSSSSSSSPLLSSSASSAAAVWYLPAMAALVGQSGVISVVDSESELCRVQFVNSETSSVSEWWLPIAHLLHVDRERDSDAWVGLEKLSDVRSAKAVSASSSLLRLYARQAVLSIIRYESEEARRGLQSVDILQLISAEMLPPLSLQQLPSLPPPMHRIVLQALAADPPLPSTVLADCRRVLEHNAITVSCGEATTQQQQQEAQDAEDDARPIIATDSRAVVLAFHASTRLPKPGDLLSVYSNSDLSKLCKQWKGGEKSKATPLLPLLLPSSSLYLLLKKEKLSSRSTAVRLEAVGVPEKLSLALYIISSLVHEGSSEDEERRGWASERLLQALTSLAGVLCTPSLSPLIKQAVFHSCISALTALHAMSAARSSYVKVPLPVALLYEEMLELFESSRKEGKLLLVSAYLQTLIELLAVVRRTGGEAAFSKAVAEQGKGKSGAGLGIAQRKHKSSSNGAAAAAAGGSSAQSKLSPIKPPVLRPSSSSSSSSSSASSSPSPSGSATSLPPSFSRPGRSAPMLSAPSSSPAAASTAASSPSSSASPSSSSSYNRAESAERQLREMMQAVGSLRSQMASLTSAASQISLAPFASSTSSSASSSSVSPSASSPSSLARLPTFPSLISPSSSPASPPLPPPPPAALLAVSSGAATSAASPAGSPASASSSSSSPAAASVSAPTASSRPSPPRRGGGQLEQLVNMGFELGNAEAAIAHFPSFSAALDALMAGWQPDSQQRPQTAAAAPSATAAPSVSASASASGASPSPSSSSLGSAAASASHSSLSPSASHPSLASSAPVLHSPANSFASYASSSLPSPLFPPSREVSVPESESERSRSELSSSLSLDSGMLGADASRVQAAGDEAASVDDLSDDYHDDDEEDEDEAEALVRAISLSLAANQEDDQKAKDDDDNKRERKTDSAGAEQPQQPAPATTPRAEEKKTEKDSTDTASTPASASAPAASDSDKGELSTPAKPASSSPPPPLPGVAASRVTTESWFDSFCLVSDLLDVLFSHSASLPAYIVEEAVAGDDAGLQQLQSEHGSWSLPADAELIALTNGIEDSENVRLTSTDAKSRTAQHALVQLISRSNWQSFPHLRSRSVDSLARRLQLFRLLNLSMLSALPLVDLTRCSSSDSSALAHRLSFCRLLLLSSLKFELIDAILELTTREKQTSKPRVLIDRQAAAASMQRDGQQSVFMQTFRQLKDTPVVQFLQPPAKGQTYTVIDIKFKGEHVVGEGGPYRQLFNDICRELQTERTTNAAAAPTAATGAETAAGAAAASDDSKQQGSRSSKTVLPLLIPSANRQVSVGEGRDKFVPQPSSSSSLHLAQFEFLGRLLGLAIRTSVLMPLDLPSFFFKPLVSQQLTVDDLEAIDASFVNGVIDKIRQLKDGDVAAFAAHFGDSLTWSTTLSDQSTVELRSRGSQTPVEFKDRHAFAAVALQARLNESRSQLRAVHRGLTAVIPDPLLSLLSWSELERRVCGTPSIDIELLKRHTEYSGCSASSPHVALFWHCLQDMSQHERRRFIQFCSGSERLPASDDEFSRGGQRIRLLIKEAVARPGERVDQRFPRSDTCFFNLELPAYSSLDVMRRMITAVITMDVGMNADDQIERDMHRHGGAGAGGGHRADREREREQERARQQIERRLVDDVRGVAVGMDGVVDDGMAMMPDYEDGDMEDGSVIGAGGGGGEDGDDAVNRPELDEVSEEEEDDEQDSEFDEQQHDWN